MMRRLDLSDPRAQLEHGRRAVKTVAVSVFGLPPVVRHIGLALEQHGGTAIGRYHQRMEIGGRVSAGMDEFRSPMHVVMTAVSRWS